MSPALAGKTHRDRFVPLSVVVVTVVVCCENRLNRTISDHTLTFQTSLFPKPTDFFLHVQIELHCNSLPIQQLSQKQHTSEKRASVSSKKSFKS